MHPILSELHRDHLNFSRILRLLENQLDLIRGGGHADLHVLNEIVDYVQSYPDLIHHPREDVIFLVYRERSVHGIDLIDRLMDEHRLLIGSTAYLREFLNQWGRDLPVPREHIAMLVSEYLQLQWDHLNLEESSVYQLLADGLTAADWERIEATIPSGSDPLFGDLMRRCYQNIFDQVMEYA